jgi:hypothetical protein
MEHIIELALHGYMSSVTVKGSTKPRETDVRNQQYQEKKCTEIGNIQRL